MTNQYLHFDIQTLKDLNLSPYSSDGKTIFELFGKAQTLGGQNCLNELLKNPFTDRKRICNRQESIRYFQQFPLQFPFPLAELDHIEYYLKSDINPVPSFNRIGRLVQGLNYRLNDSGSHYFLKDGLKQLVSFFQDLNEFVRKLIRQQLPEELEEIICRLAQDLQDSACQELFSANSNHLSLHETYRLDQLVRLESSVTIRNILNEVYLLDALYSLAKKTKTLVWHFPDVVEQEQPLLQIQSLYHPLLDQPIPNNFNLGENNHLLFLTGPNMAGKTTFLKALGISVYLAQLGLPVHAKEMRFTPFQTLITSIHTRDRLDKGYSFFFSEVQRVKDAALTLNQSSHVLLIFDELFKGTNVEDAYEASRRIISAFAQHRNNLFVLSSHLLELAPKLETLPGIFFQHFESAVKNGKPVFSYKIKEGVSTQRLGLLILENEGVLEILEGAPVQK